MFVNKQAEKAQQHGAVIKQPGICYGMPQVFRADGIHWLTEGMDIYLANMVTSLRAVLEQFRGE